MNPRGFADSHTPRGLSDPEEGEEEDFIGQGQQADGNSGAWCRRGNLRSCTYRRKVRTGVLNQTGSLGPNFYVTILEGK